LKKTKYGHGKEPRKKAGKKEKETNFVLLGKKKPGVFSNQKTGSLC